MPRYKGSMLPAQYERRLSHDLEDTIFSPSGFYENQLYVPRSSPRLCPRVKRKGKKGVVHHSLQVLHTPSKTCMCVRMPKGITHAKQAKTSYSDWISVIRRLANHKSRIWGSEIPEGAGRIRSGSAEGEGKYEVGLDLSVDPVSLTITVICGSKQIEEPCSQNRGTMRRWKLEGKYEITQSEHCLGHKELGRQLVSHKNHRANFVYISF